MISPWQEYAEATKALFAGDKDVTVELQDGDEKKLVLRVHGGDKAESLGALMPALVPFGNVTLGVEVVPDNEGELTPGDHIRRAFAGNPLFVDVVEAPLTSQTFGATYALMMPECLQYYVDNLQSPYGARTATVEDVAREVLRLPDGCFVTSAEL